MSQTKPSRLKKVASSVTVKVINWHRWKENVVGSDLSSKNLATVDHDDSDVATNKESAVKWLSEVKTSLDGGKE